MTHEPRLLDADLSTLESYQNLFFDPATGEAITSEDHVVKGRWPASQEEERVFIGSGFTFEPVTQNQPNAGTVKCSPWGHATEETTKAMIDLLTQHLPPDAVITGYGRRPQDPGNLAPYSMDAYEIEVNFSGKMVRRPAGAIAAAVVRTMAYQPQTEKVVCYPEPVMKWVIEELAREVAE